MFRVKLCGFTREDDVRAAVRAGADAVGFQMSRGPRKIPPSRARRLARLLPPWMTPVGVFVNEPVSRVNRLAAQCGFQVVQLHGDEDPFFAAKIRVPVIKAVRLHGSLNAKAWEGYSVAAFLLDRYNPGQYGGTGKIVPRRWTGQARLLPAPFLLAGGLGPDNVASVIRSCRPFGVDAASGIESAPGIKDERRTIEFVRRARAALSAI